MIWWKVLLVFLLFVSIVLAIVLPLTLKNKETGSEIPYSVPIISSYNAKVWPSIVSNSPLKISFPEFCPENNFGIRIPDINKVSIALSGGGSRSVSASLGYFRALSRMGYKNKAQYVSSVSGGSCFYSAYSYAQSNYTDEILLSLTNEVQNPTTLTIKKLQNDNINNNLFLGYRCIHKNTINTILSLLNSSNIPKDRVFNKLASYYGLDIYGPNDNVPIAINKKHAEDIIKRNPNLPKPIFFPDNIPFYISNTSLFFNYVTQYPYVVVSMTPLYSGIHQLISQDGNNIGGYFVETFAFGNTKPPSQFTNTPSSNTNCTSLTINLEKIREVTSLNDIVGTSSTLQAEAFYTFKDENPVLSSIITYDLTKLIPQYNIWGTKPLSLTTSDSQCVSDLINGGCITPNGYDILSCTRSNLKCYSNTAKQCSSNSDCSYSLSNIECLNKNSNNSSLNCNLGIFGCECKKSTPYVPTLKTGLQSQKTILADGGFSDNSGVISLLQRGVRRIISFINTDLVIKNSINDDAICSLFGKVNFKDSNLNVNKIQVFNSSDYDNIILPQLLSTFKAGGPTFARSRLYVNQNLNFGVVGGFYVDILFVLLQPSTVFENQLPSETRKEITRTDSSFSGGMFNNFPNFKGVMQNFGTDILSYNLPQVNLLSNYTDWCLNQEPLKTHVKNMFDK